MIAKRERGKMDRLLVTELTRVCEAAKPTLLGFCWLTHRVDYQHFPESLEVIWVFDTHTHLAKALKGRAHGRILDLTAEAFASMGIHVDDISRHVDFDSEEECQRAHGGNWQRRLRSKPESH
ncbi:hypothetical protein [Halomonas binhaiensis]|uniref:Fis family transcriptional regulator n=1 Tax=Halomonas binhaiensis TaxID=2562282 RepID=A0A5C1NC95_9GAMM|nr:hypothetical protein [Halomonas binhaiensis]QEM80996.1 hypothetical protein E4T21_05095 [Halomonas binhaiensis]